MGRGRTEMAYVANPPAFAFDVADDRITRIWMIRNPEKLRSWTTN